MDVAHGVRRRRARIDVGKWVFAAFCALICVFLLLPALIIVPSSFGSSSLIEFPPHDLSTKWYGEFLSDPDWIRVLKHSIYVALATSALATLLGVCGALALRRHFRGDAAARLVMIAPLLVPAIIIGSTLLSFTILVSSLRGSFFVIVAAHTLWGLPLVFMTASAAAANINPAHEEAARTLGANALKVFWHVTWPGMRVGVFVGALFAFLVSFEEFVMALFLTTPETLTLPVQVWASVKYGVSPVTAAIATMLLGVAALVIAVTYLLARRAGVLRTR
jgi:ABC-type spermidine/putrescine transport system permease subunit II